MGRHRVWVEANLDVAVIVRARLASEPPSSLAITVGPGGRVGAQVIDLALQQLKPAVTTGAGVAAVGKPEPGPQRGAQDRVVVRALVFAGSVDVD
jgi:hypothetical protein